jgi:zinc protease
MAQSALGDDEFGRVRRQMLSASAFMTDTVTWRAFRFGQLLATGAATSLSEWYDRLAAVTAEDVRAAAGSIFLEKGRVVGWFVPEAS